MKFKKLKISKQSVSLKEVFDFVLRLFEKKANTKKIKLKYDIEAELPKYIISD